VRTLDRTQPASPSTVDGAPDAVAAPERVTRRQLRRSRALRRVGLVLLVALLVAGALNLLGGRTAQATASANGYQLQVTYPRTGRPGQTAPMQIQVQKQGGFQGPVTVSVSSDYLDILDVRNLVPDPQQSTSSDKAVTWQFNQPPGDTLGITISADFEAAEHMGVHHGAITVIDSNGNPAVATHFTTWEAP